MNPTSDFERYLVALVLSSRQSASQINLSAVDLMDSSYQHIWLSAEQLESSGQPANILTIADNLKSKNIECPVQDWSVYLNTIADDYRAFKTDKRTVKNAVSHIKQTGINKRVLEIAEDLTRNPLYAGDAIQALLEATSDNADRKSTTLHDGVKKAVNQLDVYSKSHGYTGALSGISELDHETGGFQPTDFIVVGARSAMGKTAFALTNMQHSVKDGRYTGIISVEMPDMQLGMRHIAGLSGIDLKKMRNGGATETEWAQIAHAMKAVSNEERKRVLINDWTNDWDIVKTQIRTWSQNHDMSGGVWIDYLQNLKINRGGRSLEKVQEAGLISYECKALAKELNIPIIGLSQLQRTIDSQSNKRPTKANLSWASQFENDADLIILLYRHEVYHPENENAHGVAEIIIDKFRNGETAKIICCFRGKRMDFVNIEEQAKNRYINSLQAMEVPTKPKPRNF